jgi:1,4-dihydroxy-6-naphthoate synthase
MDQKPLTFGFSTCPNDTFAFHALVHGLVPGPQVEAHLDDIEALNVLAEQGALEATKISIGAYGRVREKYALMRAGGAAGFGVGPIVVALEPRAVGGRIAIPGKTTTAALLLNLAGEFETVAMRFDLIETAVLQGEVDCGVLIHEGRFTYKDKGLHLICDLGSLWEQRMSCPLPLAAIAIRRDRIERAREVDHALRASVEYAFAHPDASLPYVRQHAQEMDDTVMQRHIGLYVNEYTRQLDESAVLKFLDFAGQHRHWPAVDLPIFAAPAH